ncbi:MAG: DUF721 domain-containing protein [Fidelibacterota bacterium]|nr:MAG: DUF721 domain-containing protein [Candidatus Neomarinimicrobiota bacterium]
MLSLGEVIKDLLRAYGIDEAVKMHRATVLWEEVVGSTIARNSKALGVRGKMLFVKTRSSAWRNEIALQKDVILRAINDKIGSNLIKDIRLR